MELRILSTKNKEEGVVNLVILLLSIIESADESSCLVYNVATQLSTGRPRNRAASCRRKATVAVFGWLFITSDKYRIY